MSNSKAELERKYKKIKKLYELQIEISDEYRKELIAYKALKEQDTENRKLIKCLINFIRSQHLTKQWDEFRTKWFTK